MQTTNQHPTIGPDQYEPAPETQTPPPGSVPDTLV